MHYILQLGTDEEGIVTGLFQGCSLAQVVCTSLALICTAGGRRQGGLGVDAAMKRLHGLYSLEEPQTERKKEAKIKLKKGNSGGGDSGPRRRRSIP